MALSPHTRTRLIHRDGKKVRAHRWLMEQALGRKLRPDEHVHHKDGNPLNNDLSNLQVLPYREHMQLHKLKPLAPRACLGCGAEFTPADSDRKRSRRKCCSPACAQAVRVMAAVAARSQSSHRSPNSSAAGSSNTTDQLADTAVLMAPD